MENPKRNPYGSSNIDDGTPSSYDQESGDYLNSDSDGESVIEDLFEFVGDILSAVLGG